MQSIYAFRGADSSIIKQVAKDPEWEVHKLFRNYRSVKKICDFANSQFENTDSAYRIDMDSIKPGGSVDILTSSPDYSDGSAVNADSLQICLQKSLEWEGTTAILCRTNKEVECISEFMTQHGLRVKTNINNSDGFHILESAKDDEYAIKWLSTLLPASAYTSYIRDRHVFQLEGRIYDLEYFRNTYNWIHSIDSALSKIEHIKELIESELDEIDKSRLISEELELPEIVIENESSTTDVSESDVYVGTIHSVKGLEYDNVILVGVGGRYFRLTNEENQNLYYVGITRAKTNLYILREE